MNRHTASILLALTSVLLVFPGCGGGGSPPPADGGTDAGSTDAGSTDGGGESRQVSLRLLAFNDFHGQVEPAPNASYGGSAFLARHLRRLEGEIPNTLIVTSGDMIGASSFFSGILHDEPTIAFLNLIGVDVAVVGNHEFDRPLDELRRLHDGGCRPEGCLVGSSWEGARYPLLGANVLESDGTPAFPTHHLIEVDGVKVGFIGATTERTGEIVYPPFIAGLSFEPVIETVNALVPKLQAQGAETIVLLLHRSGSCDAAVRESLDPAIDVVLDGHGHGVYVCEGTPLVAQAGSLGERITVIDLTVEVPSQTLTSIEARQQITTHADGADPEVEALLDTYRPLVEARGNEVVGTITETLSSLMNLTGQVPAGLMVADAFLETTAGDATIAFTNAGGIRANLQFAMSGAETVDGQVTRAELYGMLPFGNTLETLTLTGAQVEALLEQQFTHAGGNALQPSRGFHYAFDPLAAPGDRIDPAEITLDGVPLDPAASYRVTVNSFIGAGGGGYPILSEGTDRVPGDLDRTAVADYLGANSPVAPPDLDRATRK